MMFGFAARSGSGAMAAFRHRRRLAARQAGAGRGDAGAFRRRRALAEGRRERPRAAVVDGRCAGSTRCRCCADRRSSIWCWRSRSEFALPFGSKGRWSRFSKSSGFGSSTGTPSASQVAGLAQPLAQFRRRLHDEVDRSRSARRVPRTASLPGPRAQMPTSSPPCDFRFQRHQRFLQVVRAPAVSTLLRSGRPSLGLEAAGCVQEVSSGPAGCCVLAPV